MFAQTKKADSPESESAFNVRDCELYERKTRLVDDIYRTTKSLCRSQAASTKNHLLNNKRHQRIKNRPTDFSTFFEIQASFASLAFFSTFSLRCLHRWRSRRPDILQQVSRGVSGLFDFFRHVLTSNMRAFALKKPPYPKQDEGAYVLFSFLFSRATGPEIVVHRDKHQVVAGVRFRIISDDKSVRYAFDGNGHIRCGSSPLELRDQASANKCRYRWFHRCGYMWFYRVLL